MTSPDRAPVGGETASDRMAYVGHCPRCDLIFAAAVDGSRHKRETAKFVAELVRDGARVERITCEAVRAATWCQCYKAKHQRAKAAKQAELALAAHPSPEPARHG